VEPFITVDKTILQDFHKSLKLEWLETDGVGGYASSTVLGINTRRYHGMLVAAASPPVVRRLLLAKVEEASSALSMATLSFSNLVISSSVARTDPRKVSR